MCSGVPEDRDYIPRTLLRRNSRVEGDYPPRLAVAARASCLEAA